MAAEGDELAAFCAREYPRLVGALDLYLGDLRVAEELAQEALLKAAARWDYVAALESPGGWVRRVALNLANSWFRRKRAERRALARVGAGELTAHDPDGADRASIRTAVRRLPARQRTALILRYYFDLPVEGAARAMGATPGAVRALTKRAVASLRTELAVVPDPHEAEAGDG